VKRLINSIWSLPALFALVPFSSAAAQSGGAESSALGVAVDVLLLVAGLLCFSLCMKIFALLKGGELSPGWQLLSVSFLIFSIGQALSIALELDFLSLPQGATGALQVLALFMIVLGVARIKKSLT
jgi:O-antigen ligase